MSVRTTVEEGDDLEEVIARAKNGTTISVFGNHTGQLTIERSDITLVNGGDAVMDRVWLKGTLGKVVLDGLKFNNTTADVTNNDQYAVTVESASACEFLDLDISGHGYNEGFRFRNTHDSKNCVIGRCHFYELENRGLFIIGEGHTVFGCRFHDLYRTVDADFFSDVDAINFHGPNLKFKGNQAYDIILSDSISTTSPGRANPSGPLGTQSPPHCDFLQTFTVYKSDGSTPWMTTDCEIVDNKCHNLVGQGIILESDRESYSVITDMLIEGNHFAVTESYQNINLAGTERVTLQNNILTMANITGGRFIWFQGGSNGGLQDNVDTVIEGNVVIGGDGATLTEDEDTYSTNLRIEDNTRMIGDITSVSTERPRLAASA